MQLFAAIAAEGTGLGHLVEVGREIVEALGPKK